MTPSVRFGHAAAATIPASEGHHRAPMIARDQTQVANGSQLADTSRESASARRKYNSHGAFPMGERRSITRMTRVDKAMSETARAGMRRERSKWDRFSIEIYSSMV